MSSTKFGSMICVGKLRTQLVKSVWRTGFTLMEHGFYINTAKLLQKIMQKNRTRMTRI